MHRLSLVIFQFLTLISLFGCRGDDDMAPALAVHVTECEAELRTPTDTSCAVSSGSPTVIMLGDVLAPDTVYRNGAVVYQNEKILCVGCDCLDNSDYADATRIDCPGASISPGLINPHEHITFSEGAPIDHGTTRYDHRHDWREKLSTPQNAHGTGASSEGNRWVEMRMLMSGVTSMVGSGSARGGVRNLDRLTDRDRDLGFVPVEFETFSLGDTRTDSVIPADCDWGYRHEEQEVADQAAYLPHVAEGIDAYAAEEFRCQSSSILGRDFTESNVAHIHSIGLQADDYYDMARGQSKLIWSPRSNISLYGITAQVNLFHRLGGSIALGTDWSYSGSANILRELACADQYNRAQLDSYFTRRDLWLMVTANAAAATGANETIGTLAPGFLSDITVFAGDHGNYGAVIDAENRDVTLVVQAGVPMFGDAPLLDQLGTGCETLDVCGAQKSVCAQREYGQNFQDLAMTVSTQGYGPFFCGAPSDEPSCVPSRPGEFTGQASDGDPDGDGIPDAQDNCPLVFNPVRPIDSGLQADLDGDGVGDACDESPLTADLDGDGFENDADNCPRVDNRDQDDSDNDNKGNACDGCPEQANPLLSCLAAPAVGATVIEVQTGVHAIGTKVALENLVVTAVWAAGYYAQDQDADVAAHSGLHVFTGSQPSLVVGDVVAVTGVVNEHFDETQIDETATVKSGQTGSIDATEVTLAQATSEEYEGVLVTLAENGDITENWDCATDNPICNDTNLWQIGGTEGLLVHDRAYQDDDFAIHVGNTRVTGVLMYRFDRRRVLPRTSADFAVPAL